MKKIFYMILIVGIAICCISIEKESTYTETNNCITYNLGRKPSNLLMTDNYNVREKDLLVALFQGLVTEDVDGEIIPALAEEYKISEDKLGYTFTIRDNLKYIDGKAIDANSFVDFFKSFLEDKNNIYASQLDCVFGAKEFREGKRNFEQVAISAKDKNTLVIRLNYESSYFIKILSQPVYVLRDYNAFKKDINNNYNKANSTGPFCVDEIEDNGELILKKNKNYYNESKITDEKIKVKFIEDSEKALAYFEMPSNDNENIDLLADCPINEYLRLSQEDKIKYFPSTSLFYLSFNINNKSLTGDINFRNAINSIISKEYYAQQISKYYAIPASLYVPEEDSKEKLFNTFGNKQIAMDFLKKTKFTGKEEITFVYEEDSFNKRISEDIVKNISDDLQIKINCKGYDSKKLSEVLDKGDYDIYLYKYMPPINELYMYYEQWYSKSQSNVFNYNNPKYDECFTKAKYEVDETKMHEQFKKCEDILKNELPAVPVYYVNTVVCINPDILGVYATSIGNIKLDYLKFKE